MSNTSYSFKENSHVIVNQGGEKKVMKKILSVALSTAMAFSMFASVAFGADAKLTDQQQFDALKQAGIVNGFPDGQAHLEKALTRAELAKIIVLSLNLTPVDATSYKDANYANHWGRTYIEAATQAGILNGKDATKKLFDPNGNVTVQELAKVLVTALKLEVPADANNSASEWAKGYVAAAIKAGYIADGINYQAQATRSQAVVAAYAIYEAAQVPTVASYTVAKDGKSVEFTLSNKEVVKVDVTLEPNKATEVSFKTKDGVELKHTVTWVVTEATKVESVSADNLKEVVVKFDGEVDKTTAELKDNYKLSGGRTVKKAVLNDAKNAVTLTLEDDQYFLNQAKYSLSVSGVKAGSKTISVNNFEFSPVDNKLPEVVSVTGLGTKAVKVVFSEPIKESYTGSFLLDGQGFYGVTKFDGRELVIKANSDLTVGEHTLTVSDVQDFNNFKSLKSEHKFTVVEDTTAPTIAEATATLEKLTVTFSEDVDSETVDKDKVYHKRGDSKIKPDRVVKLAGNKYEFYFSTTNALPSYETTIFVEGVKDYSGNEIKETSKLVKAEIDTERPTVVDAKVDATNKSRLVITFSKAIQGGQKWTDLITVKDKDGKVIQFANAGLKSSADPNILYVDFFSALPEGTNTLDIRGIKDATVLGNVMLDYSTTFNVGDKTQPKFTGASFNISTDTRRVVLYFDEKMDAASLQNPANYVLHFGTDFDKDRIGLPSDARLTVINSGDAVLIELPVEIDGVEVTKAKVLGITIQGVKDAAGNYLNPFSEPVKAADYANLKVAKYNDNGDLAELSGKNEIKVKLAQNVVRFNNWRDAVSVENNTVTDVTVDRNVVTIKVKDAIYTPAEVTFKEASFKDVSQADIELRDGSSKTVVIDAAEIADKVAPELKLAEGQNRLVATPSTTESTYTVELEFTEELLEEVSANLISQDLIVTDLSKKGDDAVLPYKARTSQSDDFFEVTVDGNKIIVVITDKDGSVDRYSIGIRNGAKFIQDSSYNVVKEQSAIRTDSVTKR